ncbi:MAG: helix-turn-helix domain-containing protein [Candidatus Bathyarchaeota archaeon]|nr:helix-turn-helix domain-containing protein [Candidatus Bathyarchaeota archaeon]
MNKPNRGIVAPEVLVLFRLSRGAKSRKRILKSLVCTPKNCSQIAKDVGLDWWTVQKHLRYLLKENIVKSLSFGNSKFYQLTQKGVDASAVVLSEDTDNVSVASDNFEYESSEASA